jgi:hypothetical protein
MKLFPTFLVFVSITEVCLAVSEGIKHNIKPQDKKRIVLSNCENQVDLTFYGEGDAPSSTALKAGEIVTMVIPLYSDADLKTAAGEWAESQVVTEKSSSVVTERSSAFERG